MKKVTFKSGKIAFFPSLEELQIADDDNTGFCLACGCEQLRVEPDACNYTCEECDAEKVYGAQEFALRGWVS